MNHREDWECSKKRWEAWWAHGMYDRPLLAITAPRKNTGPREEQSDVGADPRTKWTDFDFMIRTQLERQQHTYFGGEALPIFNPGLAVGNAMFFGCEPWFDVGTVWAKPIAPCEDGFPNLRFSPNNRWWQWYRSGVAAAAQASRGRYFVLVDPGNDAGDTLAQVRGTEQLLVDIAVNPDWVKSAVEAISDVLIQIYGELDQVASPEACGVEGHINDQRCWWQGSTRGLNCDFSCMISSRAFEDLFLPSLVKTMHQYERNVYHLDGPGALHHIDSLLDLPELQAIQWVPGAGHEEILQWVPLIRRIQAAKRSLCLSMAPEEVKVLLGEIQPEGIMIQTHCETEDEARELLERVASLY